MKNILITGGSGLLGRAILNELSHFSYTITATCRPTSIIDDTPATVNWVIIDILDSQQIEELVKQSDVVIHCAGFINFNPQKDRQTISFNEESTKHIVAACLQEKKRLIHISSVATLGSITDTNINELSDFSLSDINTGYAKSKYFAELQVWRGIAEGLNAVILNPSIIIGIPHNFKKSSGSFWDKIGKGLRYYPKGSSGFVDARDIAILVNHFIGNDIAGEQYIVNAENWSYKKFFTSIAESIHSTPPNKVLPFWLSNVLWRIARPLQFFGIAIPLSKAFHLTYNSDKVYDSRKVENELDFEFRPLKESIEWVSDAYKNIKK